MLRTPILKVGILSYGKKSKFITENEKSVKYCLTSVVSVADIIMRHNIIWYWLITNQRDIALEAPETTIIAEIIIWAMKMPFHSSAANPANIDVVQQTPIFFLNL